MNMDDMEPKRGSQTNLKLVALSTDVLRNRLNSMYTVLRTQPLVKTSRSGMFEYLWDLKEVAVLEGKKSVDVPIAWLDELEALIAERSNYPVPRGH